MRHFNPICTAEGGTSSIEFAFIAGLLAIMLLGLMDFGRGFWEQMQVANAARAGAEYATRNGYDATNIATAITSATSLSNVQASPAPTETCGCPDATTGISPQTCNVACASGDFPGTYVTARARASYRMLFSWPGLSNPVTLTASAIVRIN